MRGGNQDPRAPPPQPIWQPLPSPEHPPHRHPHTPSQIHKRSTCSPTHLGPHPHTLIPAPTPGLCHPHPDQLDRLSRPRQRDSPEAPCPHLGLGCRDSVGQERPQLTGVGQARGQGPNPGLRPERRVLHVPGRLPTHHFLTFLGTQDQIREAEERTGQAWELHDTNLEGRDNGASGRWGGWIVVLSLD